MINSLKTLQRKSKVSVKQKEKNAFGVLKQAQLKNSMNGVPNDSECSPVLKSNKRDNSELSSPYTPPNDNNKKSKATSVPPWYFGASVQIFRLFTLSRKIFEN